MVQVEAVLQRRRSSSAVWSTPPLSQSFSSTSREVRWHDCQYNALHLTFNIKRLVTTFSLCHNFFLPVDGGVLPVSFYMYPLSSTLRPTLSSQDLCAFTIFFLCSHSFLLFIFVNCCCLFLLFYTSSDERHNSKRVCKLVVVLLCSSLTRNPSAQWLIFPVALDAQQRAKRSFLWPREPEKQWT